MGKPYRNRFGLRETPRAVSWEMTRGDKASYISICPTAASTCSTSEWTTSTMAPAATWSGGHHRYRADEGIAMNDYIPAEIGFSNGPYGADSGHEQAYGGAELGDIHFALAYVMYCDVGPRRVGSTAGRCPPDVDSKRFDVSLQGQ